jgi:hypothetical protein
LHIDGRPRPPLAEILRNGSVIIRFLASKSLSLMLFGVPGLKRTSISIIALVAAGVTAVSCGSYNAPGSNGGNSKLKFRVFISNPLLPGNGGNSPVLNIVDATKDVLSSAVISLPGSPQAGLMALSPNLRFTMVFSPSGNSVAVVDNTTEGIAQTGGSVSSAVPTITLPGLTESMVFGSDNATGYAAVPTAPVTGQNPGTVEVLNLQNGTIKASIPVPGAHFIALSPDGNRMLVFSDNSDTVTVITTILIGTNSDPRSYITGFDHPVWGVFSGNTAAYVLNCGPQCSGIAAGVSVLTGLPGPGTTIGFSGTTIPVSGATIGLLSGSTLYVAGTPPGAVCGSGTAAPTCGRLSVIDTGSMTVSGSAIITDGRHNRMQISQDGQLFIGAHDCTNIKVTNGEVRGCLSIFNSRSSAVVVPPQTGDVTGIQPITGRTVVYVVQNGGLGIYDTTTDKLQVNTNTNRNTNGQVDIVGQPFDVKLVD